MFQPSRTWRSPRAMRCMVFCDSSKVFLGVRSVALFSLIQYDSLLLFPVVCKRLFLDDNLFIQSFVEEVFFFKVD